MSVTLEDAEAVLCAAREMLSRDESLSTISASDTFLTVSTAARYLRGYGDVPKAARNIMCTLQYRHAVQADSLGRDAASGAMLRREMEKRGLFIAMCDRADDVSPSPVLVLRKRVQGFDPKDFDDYRRFLFFTLDFTARLADAALPGRQGEGVDAQRGQWVVVMDMSNYRQGNSPPLNVTREVMRIFQSHFPERAKRIVVIDAPTPFYILFRIIGPWIDAATRRKFVFVNRADGPGSLVATLGQSLYDCIDIDMDDGKSYTLKVMEEQGCLPAQTPLTAVDTQ